MIVNIKDKKILKLLKKNFVFSLITRDVIALHQKQLLSSRPNGYSVSPPPPFGAGNSALGGPLLANSGRDSPAWFSKIREETDATGTPHRRLGVLPAPRKHVEAASKGWHVPGCVFCSARSAGRTNTFRPYPRRLPRSCNCAAMAWRAVPGCMRLRQTLPNDRISD